MNKYYFLIIAVFLSFILFVFLFLLSKNKTLDNDKINKSEQNICNYRKTIILDFGEFKEKCSDFVKISLSDDYRLSDKKSYILSGSKWINGTDFSLKFQGIAKVFNSKTLLRLLDQSLLKKTIVFYDEFYGRKASLFVFVLKNLGKEDVFLYNPNNSNLNKKDIVSISGSLSGINDKYIKNYKRGFISLGNINIVFNPKRINFSKNSLFLYVSDKATMKQNRFFRSLSGASIDVKNLYWSRLFDMENNIKPKDNVIKLLKRNSIELNKYSKMYLYYPKKWWRSSLVALIFKQYFSKQ